ncbi:MAG: alanine racemase [Clostridiaceae bacterium]|nr:alanine racemase [Clostridiaceae bacterium]
MKTLTVEKSRILANLEAICAAAGDAQLIAVLKANAYGLDLRQMAGLLQEQEVRRFAVTEPQDAVSLREWGFSEQEILILRSTALEEDVRLILQSGSTATIGSYDAAVALCGLAEKENMLCDVHIKIDTGMGRYGFAPNELDRILSVYRFMANLSVTGMYTHYANAFRVRKKTQAQYDAFMGVAEKVRTAGFDPGLLHASNSAGLFFSRMPSLDAVRIGSAIGGRLTAKGEYGLQKAGHLNSEVCEVRWLQKGATVGYGSAFVAKRPTRIAVIPVGSADGILLEKGRDIFRFGTCFRAAGGTLLAPFRGKRFFVFVDGKRARVLGHVGLTHTVADVTDIDCAAGTPVSFEISPLYVPASIPRIYVE